MDITTHAGYLAMAYRLARRDAELYENAFKVMYGKPEGTHSAEELAYLRGVVRMALVYLGEPLPQES